MPDSYPHFHDAGLDSAYNAVASGPADREHSDDGRPRLTLWESVLGVSSHSCFSSLPRIWTRIFDTSTGCWERCRFGGHTYPQKIAAFEAL